MALYNRRPSTPARQFSSPRCFRKNPLSGLITALILYLVTIIPGSSLLAQDGTENQDAATLRALNGTLLRLQDELQHAGPRLVPTLRSQVSTVLNKRAFVLQRMVRLNPEEAVSFALSPELRADLSATFPDAAPLLETQGTIRGVVEVSVEDSADLKHSKTHV